MTNCPFWYNKSKNIISECTLLDGLWSNLTYYVDFYIIDNDTEYPFKSTNVYGFDSDGTPIGLAKFKVPPNDIYDWYIYALRNRVDQYDYIDEFNAVTDLNGIGYRFFRFSNGDIIFFHGSLYSGNSTYLGLISGGVKSTSVNKVYDMEKALFPWIGGITTSTYLGYSDTVKPDNVDRIYHAVRYNTTVGFCYTDDGSTLTALATTIPALTSYTLQLIKNDDPTSTELGFYQYSNNTKFYTVDTTSGNVTDRGLLTLQPGWIATKGCLCMYGDKVIMLEQDNTWSYVAVLRTNYTTYAYTLATPCTTFWSPDCNPGDMRWPNYFCVDPDTETLFSIYNHWDSDNYLFKSSDWGQTWELVFKLAPTNYYEWRFNQFGDGSWLNTTRELFYVADGTLFWHPQYCDVKQSAEDNLTNTKAYFSVSLSRIL